MKPPLIASLGIQLHGVPKKLRIANLMVLAAELECLHKELNYHIKGAPLIADGGCKKTTWADFCLEQAGISDGTAKTYLEYWDLMAARLSADSRPETRQVLELMTKRPSHLKNEERNELVEGIQKYAMREGDTPGSLRIEFRQDKAERPTQKANTLVGDAEERLELLAIAYGVTPANAKEVAAIVRRQRFHHSLAKRWLETVRNGRNKL